MCYNLLKEWNLENKGAIEKIRYNEDRVELYCSNGTFLIYVDEDLSGETTVNLAPNYNPKDDLVKSLNEFKFITPRKLESIDFSTLSAGIYFRDGSLLFQLKQKSDDEDVEYPYALNNLETIITLEI